VISKVVVGYTVITCRHVQNRSTKSEQGFVSMSRGCPKKRSIDFGSLVAQTSSSNKSIAIIGTLDVGIKLVKWLIFCSPIRNHHNL